MEFRILGPLFADADTGKGPAVIRQPLLQSALAVLLLRANATCTRDWLIDALWGSEPPTSPEASLRVCISRLRRDLGECAGRLESVGPPGGRAPGHRLQRGYRMRIKPGELDVDEFSDLAAQGKAELEMGNAAAATAALAQALELWGDPPLPALPGTPAVAAAATELRAKRSAAMDDLFEARLAAGDYEHVLGQLRAAVLADPGRERTGAQLMRACRALGMRKEALDVYRRVRQATLAELGAEPGPELAFLHRQMLTEELAGEGPAAQLTRLALAAPRLPAWQVPAPPADFTGRAGEISQIVDSLARPGVPITIVTGGPGAGKTVTAAAAALQLRPAFPDGQLYVELGGIEHPRDPQQVLADLLHTLGYHPRAIPEPGPSRGALYRSIVADRKVLVVADDAASARQIQPLLPAALGAALLVTSRGRLAGLAGAHIVQLGELPFDDALALFASAPGNGRVGADAVAAAGVIRACGGLPLALRLAGSAIATRPGLTVTKLANDLTHGRPLDVLSVEDVSVSAAISSSYYGVSSSARAALTLTAAMTPGDVPAWVLESLSADQSAGPANPGDGDITEQLTAAGLIAAGSADAGAVRYRVHPLIRAYAAQRWKPHTDEALKSVARVRRGWLQRADRAAARLPAVPYVAVPTPLDDNAFPAGNIGGRAVAVEWLEAEQANLRAAIEHACEAGDHRFAAMLATRIIAWQCISGRCSEAVRTWRSILAGATGHSTDSASASYYLAVALAEARAGISEAARLLADCVPELEQAGQFATAAAAHALLARCASADGRHALAVRSARSAMRLAAGVPHAELASVAAVSVLGLTLARAGMVHAGQERCEQALRRARELRQPAYEAAALMTVAQVLVLAGQHAAAADTCRAGVRVARAYGSEITAARFLVVLGRACQRNEDWPGAKASLTEALSTFGTIGSPIEEVTACSLLAACSRSTGDQVEAAANADRLRLILARERNSPDALAATLAACVAAAS